MSAPDRQPAAEYSRGQLASQRPSRRRGAAAVALLATGLTGALLLIVAELSTLYEVRVGDLVAEVTRGSSQHAWALLVLGAGALALTALAGTGSRVATGGVLAIGVIALGIGLVGDLTDATRSGTLENTFVDAEASPGPGLWLELAGGAALVLAGGGLLLTGARDDDSPEAEPPPARPRTRA